VKKYTIHFQGKKMRTKKDVLEPKVVDKWEDTFESNVPPATWHLTDFVYHKHGISSAHFYYVPGQPGLFRATQSEDRHGSYNSKGRYLAQIDVQITATRNVPVEIAVGTLGRPPFREG
jgi:hypothetical protein